MRPPTVIFERYTVVRVPFPFTDRTATKNRPALVLSDAEAFNTPVGHSVMAMIISQSNAPWPLDCPLTMYCGVTPSSNARPRRGSRPGARSGMRPGRSLKRPRAR
ncbi:type II toxin-antitoxin system PemK/MazF family toxin [Allochromatium palmeri]|uniref:type II toxin-antitoxin system PemK/MazF family toxin n=1 Tax=Allochromatium palmeri TaxID=231048 RepID=UPI0031B5DD86